MPSKDAGKKVKKGGISVPVSSGNSNISVIKMLRFFFDIFGMFIPILVTSPIFTNPAIDQPTSVHIGSVQFRNLVIVFDNISIHKIDYGVVWVGKFKYCGISWASGMTA